MALFFSYKSIAFDLAVVAEVAGRPLNAAFQPHNEDKKCPQ